MIHNFVLGKMEEKGKGRGWGGRWVLGAQAPSAAGGLILKASSPTVANSKKRDVTTEIRQRMVTVTVEA